jgi:hypothetical protein
MGGIDERMMRDAPMLPLLGLERLLAKWWTFVMRKRPSPQFVSVIWPGVATPSP